MRIAQLKSLHAQSDQLLHLDMLRFIAACGIVIHHSAEFFFNEAVRPRADHQTASLALFVDLFFVISGYVIAYVYANRILSPAEFGKFVQRRVGRLIPLHWLTLACSIVLWVLLLKLGGRSTHTPSFRPECIAVTAALIQAGISCGKTTFNEPSWSISAEMAMYLVFPLFVYFGSKLRQLPLILGAAILAVIVALIVIRQGVFHLDTWTRVQAYARAAPSFIIGVGLWFVRDRVRRIPNARLILFVSLGATLFGMIVGAPAGVVLVLVYVLVVAAIAADLQGNTGRFVIAAAPLGQLTYSIYMWHSLFILVIMNALGDKMLHGTVKVMIPLCIISYILILGWAYVSFIFIETPARRWVDSLPLFGRRADRLITDWPANSFTGGPSPGAAHRENSE